MICAQEISNLTYGFLQHRDTRQIYHPEMIWILPVERTAMTNQNMLVMQQIQRELLIGVDIELFDVQLREDIKRRFRLNCGNAGNFIEHLIDQIGRASCRERVLRLV